MEQHATAAGWLKERLGRVPDSSLGYFRAGVAFYTRRRYAFAAEMLERAVAMDAQNFNAFQVLSRCYLALNRRDDAVGALKKSVQLDNPSDWQLLVELTGGGAGSAEGVKAAAAGTPAPPAAAEEGEPKN